MAKSKTSKGYYRETASIRDATGKLKLKYFEAKTQREAKEKKAKYLLEHGRSIPIDDPSGTLEKLFELVDAHLWRQLDSETRRNYNSYASRWTKIMGHRTVSEITAPEITRALAPLENQVSTRTIQIWCATLTSAMKYAVSDLGWRTDNPVPNARKPKGRATAKHPPLTWAEFNRVLSELPEPERTLCDMMSQTGMRPSEALRVQPAHLIYRADHWWIDVQGKKTDAAVRMVPITDAMARRLERDIFDPLRKNFKDPVRHMREVWGQLSDARFYDIRGLYATELRRRNVPDDVRKLLMGHSDIRTTETFYDKLTPADLVKVLGE